MAATSTLRDYRERLAGMPAKNFIGSILWYSIAGTVERGVDGKRSTVPVRVHQDQLAQWFDEIGLDEDDLPPRIKKIDAFRNATSHVKREYACGEEGSGQYATLRIEEVKSDSNQVIRHVVKDVRDERRERLSREHLATVKFIRGGRTAVGRRTSGDHVRTQILTRVKGVDFEECSELLAEFNQRYDDLAAYLHAPALRGVVRALLMKLNAVAMKTSGGVYFVHKTRWDDLDKVQRLLHCIGQGCVIEQFELIDKTDSRRMLTDAFESEVEDDCRVLLKTIAQANAEAEAKTGLIPARRYAEVNAAYSEVEARSLEMSELLGVAQGRAHDALEMALSAVIEMAGRVDYGKKGARS